MTKQVGPALSLEGYTLRETHISWVWVGESRVLKVKKPVNMGFLDFSTVELRHAACLAEVELNRRLADGVYLGVRSVHEGPAGQLSVQGEGAIVDWAVEMKRLRDDQSAQAMLDAGGLTPAHLEQIAVRLADFHANCRVDEVTAEYGTLRVIQANVNENFEQTRAMQWAQGCSAVLESIETFQRELLEDHGLFAERIQQGRVRDGHGDLRLEHVYFTAAGLQIIDCIEFNERFRYADVAADVAFLCMDLAYRGRRDFAELLLGYYAREAADYGLYRVIDFYMSYRAHVRAKVAGLRLDQEQADRELLGNALRLLDVADISVLLAQRRPYLLVVCGTIATGKSTLAKAVGERLGVPALSSDCARKDLAGVGHLTSLGTRPYHGAYAADVTGQVYATLVQRAELVLATGRPVIVDATCSQSSQRQAFRAVGEALGVRVRFVECTLPQPVMRERLQRRSLGPSVSDAGPTVLDSFLAAYEAPTEIPVEQLLKVDTSIIDESTLDRITAFLEG